VLLGVIWCVSTVHVKGHELGRKVEWTVFIYHRFKCPLFFCDYCLLHWSFVLCFPLVHISGQCTKFRDPVIIIILIYFHRKQCTNVACVCVCVLLLRVRAHTLLFSVTRPCTDLWDEYVVCCTKEVNIVLL
jgi:hypothetical protein